MCERGIRTFETAYRNVLDVTAIAVLKRETHLPVIVDPSHAGGKAWMVPALSCAAVAAGADGLLIEVHPNPPEAWCDADQALTPAEFATLMDKLDAIARARTRIDRKPATAGVRCAARDRRAARVATRVFAIISRFYEIFRASADGSRQKLRTHAIEAKWYPFWESHGLFKPSMKPGAPAFCIQLPPPNVTGTLHMGHAFQQTLMDVLIRYHRMRGDNTLWQVGTDHAGIATQIVVENQLKAEGTSRRDLGRDKFIERVWEWKEESGSTITHQMRRLGASCDWSRERFTMDEGLSAAVIETFVRLYDDGLIYRGKRLVNWDPKLGTAVSDLEVESEEETGQALGDPLSARRRQRRS